MKAPLGTLTSTFHRKPHCTDLKRSAAHCIKRNKTASLFLDQKSPSARAELFSMARKKSKELVELAKLHQEDVAIKVKQKMVGNQNKLLDREIGLMSREGKIREKVGEVGVCSSTAEVDNLRERERDWS